MMPDNKINSDAVGKTPLFSLKAVSKHFKLDAGLFASTRRKVWALNNIDLQIFRGETYGLVGESGSGKTTLARTLVSLVPHSEGEITYHFDKNTSWKLSGNKTAELKTLRSQVKYVFQDPSSALDPRMSVFSLLTAGAVYSPAYPGKAALPALAKKALEAVGLREADLERRPSEFSGGQRQRISLARALLLKPQALICDEVVSALDVSIQGQILNLLIELKREYELTMVFIAHDLTVVSYMADRIGVMYGGCLVEEGSSAQISTQAQHPYTHLLYQAMPQDAWASRKAQPNDQAGIAPRVRVDLSHNPTVEPKGCPFAPRCPLVLERCLTQRPPLKEYAPGHRVACHAVD